MSPTTTLILNHYMLPHRVSTWQEAITELFTDKVEILRWYDDVVVYHNAERGITMKMPAVARLLKPVATHKKGVKFSRVNVMARDNFVCQYCGNKFAMSELNYDHVLPRVQGGKTVWENIVTSCYDCNDKKGARTPEQAKMKLIRKPFKPKTLPLAQPVLAMRDIPLEWEPWTGSVAV
jgi:5-methylcytosine-specific restriction endonuclease McrA